MLLHRLETISQKSQNEKWFSEKNSGKYKGFMAWLYDFIKFKKLYITEILKISYKQLPNFAHSYTIF